VSKSRQISAWAMSAARVDSGVESEGRIDVRPFPKGNLGAVISS